MKSSHPDGAKTKPSAKGIVTVFAAFAESSARNSTAAEPAHANYRAAFVLDPDGNCTEVAFRGGD
jgi:hypothetical protein